MSRSSSVVVHILTAAVRLLSSSAACYSLPRSSSRVPSAAALHRRTSALADVLTSPRRRSTPPLRASSRVPAGRRRRAPPPDQRPGLPPMVPRSFPAASVMVPPFAGAPPKTALDGAGVVCPSAGPAAVHARWSATLLTGAEADHSPFVPYASAALDLWTPDSCSTPQLQCSMDTNFVWKNRYAWQVGNTALLI